MRQSTDSTQWATRAKASQQGSFSSTYNTLSAPKQLAPPSYLPRPQKYAMQAIEQQQRRRGGARGGADFSRTYHPGLQTRARPTTVPDGVIALDNFNQPYKPWRIPEDWKPQAAPKRAQTAALALMSRPIQHGVKSFKYSFMSAGRDLNTPRSIIQNDSKFVDPEQRLYPSGLGYGKKHRHHYVYRGAETLPRLPINVRNKYMDRLEILHNLDAKYN